MPDFEKAPFVAIWETTRACDLACRHCRAEAIPEPQPGQLSTDEGFRLIEDLSAMGTPIFVLSGGDPAKRKDLCHLVAHGSRLGMRMATVPAATPLLTADFVWRLKQAGLDQMALSLDGPTGEIHDQFRGVEGAFDITRKAAGYARQAGLPFQINTVFSAYNFQHFEAMSELVERLGVVFWEVFFLVPMGRGTELGQMTSEQFEELFERLAVFSSQVDFIVKVTEAPHYRRFQFQKMGLGPSRGPGLPTPFSSQLPGQMTRSIGPQGSIGLAPKGVNSGKGHLFVSHCGDIFPSGFLPLACGNVRDQSIQEVYRNHPVFRELRSPELLKGKCGICEYRDMCGGSRARAYAMTGDYLEAEPFCAYQPMEPDKSEASGKLN